MLIYFIKRRGIVYEQFYLKYFGIYIGAWFFSSIIARKFTKIKRAKFSQFIKPNINAFFIMLGVLAFISFKVKMEDVSRMVILLSLSISFSIELFIKIIQYKLNLKEIFKRQIFRQIKIDSFPTFIFGFLLLTITIVIMARCYLPVTPSENYFIVYAIIYFSWFISAFYSHQFHISVKENYFKAIYPQIKSLVFFISIVLFDLFILRLNPKNNVVIIKSLLIFVTVRFILITFLFIIKHPPKTDEIFINYFSVNEFKAKTILTDSEEQFQCEGHKIIPITSEIVSLKEKLEFVYLSKNKKLFEFINKSLKLNSIRLGKTEILRSSDSYNVEILPDSYLELFMNLHELNDQRRINKYFINVNKKLQLNGIYIGLFEPNLARYSYYLEKYPYFIAIFFYTFDFIWRRVFPKLPILQNIYFLFSNGKKRAISKAEGLGRLYYCGFEVIAIKQLDNMLYFIAKKMREPKSDKNPSYGPIFKMKRIGKNGKKIFVYKFRTMHPYSEYLHDFMATNYGYKDNGKLNGDFRKTSWGYFLRKTWIDELPQLYNWIKGDLSLVGIRAFGDEYLKNYPMDFKRQREKFKPGCIPTYVSLNMDKGVEYRIKSEKIYMEQKMERPIWTDIKFFFLAVYNILSGKIRSA